jgi:hypothetical protein
LQLVVGLAALAVDPHLAFPDDSVDARARHTVELGNKKIIEALVALGRGYIDETNGGFLRFY